MIYIVNGEAIVTDPSLQQKRVRAGEVFEGWVPCLQLRTAPQNAQPPTLCVMFFLLSYILCFMIFLLSYTESAARA